MNYSLKVQVWIQTFIYSSDSFKLVGSIIYFRSICASTEDPHSESCLFLTQTFLWPLGSFGLDDRGLHLQAEGPKWIQMYVFT